MPAFRVEVFVALVSPSICIAAMQHVALPIQFSLCGFVRTNNAARHVDRRDLERRRWQHTHGIGKGKSSRRRARAAFPTPWLQTMLGCVERLSCVTRKVAWEAPRMIPVSVKKHPFYESHYTGVQQKKLLSSHWFGALKANIPMCIIFRRSVFSQTTVSLVETRPRIRLTRPAVERIAESGKAATGNPICTRCPHGHWCSSDPETPRNYLHAGRSHQNCLDPIDSVHGAIPCKVGMASLIIPVYIYIYIYIYTLWHIYIYIYMFRYIYIYIYIIL